MIDLVDVTKSFRQASSEVRVLSGISLHVGRGESVAILGRSGSGKSTLLSLISGIDQPSSGTIKVDSNDLKSLKGSALQRFRAERFGVVYQDHQLIPYLTALENVSLPLEILGRPSPGEAAARALQQVLLTDRAAHRPATLSGGEAQRVSLARAFVTRPAIILADEPSGSLDDQTGILVMDLMFSLVHETEATLLLVTHDLNLARRCDHQVQLIDGGLRDI